jgi:hypothetical protein
VQVEIDRARHEHVADLDLWRNRGGDSQDDEKSRMEGPVGIFGGESHADETHIAHKCRSATQLPDSEAIVVSSLSVLALEECRGVVAQ